MLGAPADDWEQLRELVDGIVVSRGIVRTPEMMEEGSRSFEVSTIISFI